MGRQLRMRDEAGFALASTIGILGVVTLLVIALTSATISVTRQTGRDVSWNAALAAAEAGVEDFQFRLNSQPDYWRRVPNPDGTANPNLDAGNAAFTSFVPVSGTENGAAFTYTVDQRVTGSPPEGRIIVTSTGAVGGVTRTVRVTFERQTFLDFAYFADYGTLDPELYTTWPPNLFDGDLADRDASQPADFQIGPNAVAVAKQQCAPYWRYSTDRPLNDPTDSNGNRRGAPHGRHPDCHEFQFNNATFDGPFHFNDQITLRGLTSTWLREASTSYSNGGTPAGLPNPPYFRISGGAPSFAANHPLSYRERITFPPNNRELRDTAALPRPGGGYVFTGPTRIVMDDDRIYVSSPASGARYTNMSAGGEGWLPLPPNGVVYVESAPAATCPAGWRPPLGGIAGSTVVQDYLTSMYPTYPTASANDDITSYSCTAGDAYVEGELLGRLTIATANDVVVTWHIGYDSSPTASTPSGYAGTPPTTDRDMLGLIADGQIRVLKPTRCVSSLVYNGQTTGVCFHGFNIGFRNVGGARKTVQDLTIYGALLTTKRAMNVANATIGGRIGRLTVVGTLTERFASYTGTPSTDNGVGGGHQVETSRAEIPDDCNDPISTTDPTKVGDPTTPQTMVVRSRDPITNVPTLCSTIGGLFKRFVYDSRVQYIEPPHFLAPDEVSWTQKRFEELARPSSLPALPVATPSPSP